MFRRNWTSHSSKYKLYPFKYWNESKGEGRRGSGYSGQICVGVKKVHPLFANELEYFKNDSGDIYLSGIRQFSLINMYVPNSGGNIELRKDYWDIKLKKLMDTKVDKPFILTGDFNVVHEETDIWNPVTLNHGKMPGLFPHERYMFNKFLKIIAMFIENLSR